MKELAAEFWGISRIELASSICELLGWRRQNRKLKTVECGHFLLDLAEQEIIKVLHRRSKGRAVTSVKHGVATIDQQKFFAPLNSLAPSVWKRLSAPRFKSGKRW